AMAPGTRIGAAHPVELGRNMEGDMRAKLENDTAAFIRTIAERRKRNPQWAENAVRRSSSSTEQEALREKVIDFVSPNLTSLLESMDGKKLETAAGTLSLKTKSARVVDFEMDWRTQILRVLTDPNISYILMMVGIYGILYEIIHPGAIFPGVAG